LDQNVRLFSVTKEIKMFKIRILSLVVGSVLIFTGLAAFQAFKPGNEVKSGSQQAAGMGDLRRFEAQISQPASFPSIGQYDGDEDRITVARRTPVTGHRTSSPTQIGMGNLRLAEASQPANARWPVGMGDLRRFEAR
jgi:hypothetical protein